MEQLLNSYYLTTWQPFIMVYLLLSFDGTCYDAKNNYGRKKIKNSSGCGHNINPSSVCSVLNGRINKVGSVLRTVPETLEVIMQRRVSHKSLNITDNSVHSLHDRLMFSQRLLQLQCNKEHYGRSFLPTALTALLNNN